MSERSGEPADLFPGFAARHLDAGDVKLFARIGGSGPPVVLVHGYPQTHVEWRHVAPRLAARHTLVVLDLRGYGDSDAPPSRDGAAYAKRVMAGDVVAAMAGLGFDRFAYVGHDRGARVGYRLALDHPGRLTRLAVLDIVPTAEMWRGMNAKLAMAVYHWQFLAQPAPLPETMIGRAPREYIDHTLASWTKTKTLDAFGPAALAHYRALFDDPRRIHACCEDYRAGATLDWLYDEADLAAGRTIETPLLALWGAAGLPAQGESPLDVWRRWAGRRGPRGRGRTLSARGGAGGDRRSARRLSDRLTNPSNSVDGAAPSTLYGARTGRGRKRWICASPRRKSPFARPCAPSCAPNCRRPFATRSLPDATPAGTTSCAGRAFLRPRGGRFRIGRWNGAGRAGALSSS
jgi:haloacetate dehalogenase